jgi:hypothetical protein
VKFVFSRRQEDTLHQKVGRALDRSSPATKVFRNQVFFENDPSSAASLRSATRKEVKDGWLWGFVDQEDPEITNTNHARPSSGDTRVGRMGPVLELTILTAWRLEAGARYWSSPSLPPSSLFSSQVFSEYDPSSATSLLSSAAISA